MENRSEALKEIESGLIIERTFNAPRQLVWQTWTEPEKIKQWWGPTNYTAPVCKVDFRVGGGYLYCMRSTEGINFWSKGTYLEINTPSKIVVTDSFSDENGNIFTASELGFPGDWPLELVVTITLDEANGKTFLKLHHEGIPGEFQWMTEAGWIEALDKFEKALAKDIAI